MRWIIVLGMHRSGTSAFTRAVGRLGASVGDESRLKKHYENVPLRHINERLLADGGGGWDAPPPRGWLDDAAAKAMEDRARKTVAKEFGDEEVVVWKDPRTCLTLPFWLNVIDADPAFLLIYRHPTEVANSLAERNRTGPGHAYALWERHNADALDAIVGRPTVVLDYANVVTEPVQQLQIVHDALTSFGFALDADPATVDHGLIAQERHHIADGTLADGTQTFDADPVATQSQRLLLRTLSDLRGSHESLALSEPLGEPSPLSAEILALAARLRHANRTGPGQPGAKRGARRQAARRGRLAGDGADGPEASTDEAGAPDGDAPRSRAARRSAAKARRGARAARGADRATSAVGTPS